MTLQDFLHDLHPPSHRSVNPLKWYFPLCFLAVIFASALRRRNTRIICTVPIAALFSRFHYSYAAEPKVDYPLSLWLMWIFLRYLDISLVGANDKMWRFKNSRDSGSERNNSDRKDKAAEYLRDGTLVTRLKKSLSLWMTLRGIGWNWEIKHMNLHQGTRT